jgi:hypothetical protein
VLSFLSDLKANLTRNLSSVYKCNL